MKWHNKDITTIRRAAEQGDAEAQFALGACYNTGECGLPEDLSQAQNWYRKAARQGHYMAQTMLNMLPYEVPNKSEGKISAEQILKELQDNGVVNKDTVMECAYEIYKEHFKIPISVDGAIAIIEALKLFVKVNELESKENEDRNSIPNSTTLKFIAQCNLVIFNINQAYCVARQGLDAVEATPQIFMDKDYHRSIHGADTLKEVINMIEANFLDQVEDVNEYWRVDANEICTSRFERIAGIIL